LRHASCQLWAWLIFDVRQYIRMRTVRWLACFPGAFIASHAAWFLTMNFLGHSTYGGSLAQTIVGLAPLVLHTATAAVVFVVSGAIISPSRSRRVVFVFFCLSLLWSGGGWALLQSHGGDIPQLWLAAALGIVAGSVAGLLLGLRIQGRRSKPPNKAPEPTPTAVTPRANE
jgi:hypothetical protein